MRIDGGIKEEEDFDVKWVNIELYYYFYVNSKERIGREVFI